VSEILISGQKGALSKEKSKLVDTNKQAQDENKSLNHTLCSSL